MGAAVEVTRGGRREHGSGGDVGLAAPGRGAAAGEASGAKSGALLPLPLLLFPCAGLHPRLGLEGLGQGHTHVCGWEGFVPFASPTRCGGRSRRGQGVGAQGGVCCGAAARGAEGWRPAGSGGPRRPGVVWSVKGSSPRLGSPCGQPR